MPPIITSTEVNRPWGDVFAPTPRSHPLSRSERGSAPGVWQALDQLRRQRPKVGEYGARTGDSVGIRRIPGMRDGHDKEPGSGR
jgi:hypothetical protein